MTFLSFSICIIDEMCVVFRMEETREDGIFKFQIYSLITRKTTNKTQKNTKQQKQSDKKPNNNKHTHKTTKQA